jgi:zinc transporter 9
MLSASGIFFVGAGVTIYHGIAGLVEPHMPHLTLMTFVVLGLSLLVEGFVLLCAVKLVNAQRGQTPFLKYVREQAEPATLAILLEDAAAVFGLFLAAAGIASSDTSWPATKGLSAAISAPIATTRPRAPHIGALPCRCT